MHSYGTPACMYTYTGADKGQHSWPMQSTDHSFHYILFCLGDAEGLWVELLPLSSSYIVSEWTGFVGVASGKG